MSKNKLLDFVGKRKENIENKRREFERVLFNNVLGAYSVIDKNGAIYPVDLIDISHDGCMFQIFTKKGDDAHYADNSEVTIRLYFTKKSFIPVSVNVKHSSEYVDHNGSLFFRYGCEFDKSLPSFSALRSFIDFMYKFAEHSTIDKNDSKYYFL